MPTAICNECQELITWPQKKGTHMKHQVCSCGSRDLTAVSAHLNAEDDSWEYKDRNGATRKVVSRNVSRESKSLNQKA